MNGIVVRVTFCCFLLIGASAASAPACAETLALVGGSVYASPDAAPLPDAVVVASNGVITAIGSRSEVQIPADARVIDCTGKTVVAGFWNSHVHFTQAVWNNAGTAPAAPLQEHMQEMLTRWGFTTVWDLGSDARDTLPLRRRVDSGEVPGPAYLSGRQYLSRRTAIPSICRPRCNCPRPPRRTKPRNWRAAYMGLARRYEAVHRLLQGRRQAGGEHGPGHRQGGGRCGACRGQAGIRPSAKHGGR